MKIIHISDLHYGATGSKTQEVVDKIIAEYDGQEIKPLIINSGDLVEDAKKQEMAGSSRVLQKLIDAGFEMLICPGNHDLWLNGYMPGKPKLERFDAYYRDLLPKGKNFYGEQDNNLIDFPLVHQYGDYFFIGLNSNDRTNLITSAHGKIGKEQLRELNETLTMVKEQNPAAKIVVYLHHHPFKYPLKSIPGQLDYNLMKLRKRKNFLSVIKNRVDVLLFGHIHKAKRLTTKEEKYGIGLIHLGAKTAHAPALPITEIDLETNTLRNY